MPQSYITPAHRSQSHTRLTLAFKVNSKHQYKQQKQLKDMTEFQQNTETLRGQLEKGDIAKICERAACVPNTLYSAWNKTAATELTKTEKAAYDAFVAFVNDRIREKEQLSQRAAKVAEKLQN